MKTENLYNPNWRLINKLIAEGNTKEVRIALKKLDTKINEKCQDYWRQKKLADLAQKVKDLQALPDGTELFYTGMHKPILGKSGKKVLVINDGRKYILVDIEGIHWRLPYKDVRTTPLTDEERRNLGISIRVSEAVNKLFTT